MLSKQLFDILVCPKDHAQLVYTEDRKGLKCVKCGTVYPIEDDIPNFLV